MESIPELFGRLARAEFRFLESGFGFSVTTTMQEDACAVRYDAARIRIEPYWNHRLECDVELVAKVDTFWIRPASSHRFSLLELLHTFAPDELRGVPAVDLAHPSVAGVRALLSFEATMLRRHGEPLLRGDLSLCEDMLIARYCERAKSIPWDDYVEVLRAEISSLSAEEKKHLEAAFATRSARTVYFALEPLIGARRLWSERLLTTLNDLRDQHFH